MQPDCFALVIIVCIEFHVFVQECCRDADMKPVRTDNLEAVDECQQASRHIGGGNRIERVEGEAPGNVDISFGQVRVAAFAICTERV